MARTTPLPPPLDTRPFSTAEGAAFGLQPSRLRAKDLCSPFASVRVLAEAAPDSLPALAAAYAQKMAAGAFFSHATAAMVHRMWLPLAVEQSRIIDVSVIKPARAPRDRGVRGHHLVDRPGLVRTRGGLRVSNPVETWCQLATVLSVPDLVAAGDSLLTPDQPRVRITLERMAAAARDPARPAHPRLARAVLLVRPRSRSAQETALRLLIIGDGLREPLINFAICDVAGRFVAEGDLVYPELKIVLEYEGDQHRTDKKQFRKDLARYEALHDLGWRVIRVTADDLKHPAPLLARLRRMLSAVR